MINKLDKEIEKRMQRLASSDFQNRMSKRLSKYKQQVHGKNKVVSYDVETTIDDQGVLIYYPVVNGSAIGNQTFKDAEDALMEARKVAIRVAS